MRSDYLILGLIFFVLGIIFFPIMILAIIFNIMGLMQNKPESSRPMTYTRPIDKEINQSPLFASKPQHTTTPKFCSQCGSPLGENYRFCENCGFQIYESQSE